MDRTLVYVHGIGPQPPEDALKRQWDIALLGVDAGERSRFAYYADLLHPVTVLAGPLPALDPLAIALDRSGSFDPSPLPASDEFVTSALVHAALSGAGELPESVTEPCASLRAWASRMVYASDALAAGEAAMAPRAVELFPGPAAIRQALFRALVEATLHDVYAYFYGGQGPQIRARLQQVLERIEGPAVVVGHSLGSAICYDVLRGWRGPSLTIPLLTTLGSPLGVTEIQDVVVSPLEVPDEVDLWVNAFDSRDVLTLNSTLRPDYPPAEKCLDYFVVNNSENHHDAQEYLRASVVQQAVHSALTA